MNSSVKIEYGPYNSRRYKRPWGAVVTFVSNKPQYNFDAGSFIGDDNGGVVVIKCQPGDIIATGQKDGRGGNTSNVWYIVAEDGSLAEVTRVDAYDYWERRLAE